MRALLEKQMALVSTRNKLTALALAIQAANSGISGQELWTWRLNCSLGNFSQLMVIMLYQKIFEAEDVFDKPEGLVVKRIELLRKKYT